MKNGICSSCGSTEVYRVGPGMGYRERCLLSVFSSVKLAEYICCGCGMVETFVADMNDLWKIKNKCKKIEETQ